MPLQPPDLSPGQRATLRALAEVVAPGGDAGVDLDALVEAVEGRLAAAPPAQRGDFRRALALLGSGFARLLVDRRWQAWERLPTREREQRFAAWGTSPFPVARTVYQGVRRLLLSTFYASDAGRRIVGVLAPLQTRPPAVSWEGPLAGASSHDAVARAEGAPVTAHRPSAPRPGLVTLGHTLSGALHLKADVVIVGSGAGGAVAAALLAEAGRDVVIVEEGSWVDATDFDGDEGRLTPLLFADQGMRATDDLAVSLVQGGAVGGGTTVNWMIMLRTPDHVFDEWGRRFGLNALTPQAMAPVFAEVEGAVHSRPIPDDAHSPSNRVILDGAARLGWRASAAKINARNCVRAGSCSLGCGWDAKQDARLTWLPRAFARGARLVTNAQVQRVEVRERASAGGGLPLKRVHATIVAPPAFSSRGGADTAPGAIASDGAHRQASLTIDAPVVILAAGAIGTPAILQRSGMGGGAVGRYLRLHPTTCVMGRYDRPMYPFAGIPLSAMCDEFLTSAGHGYGFWIECPALGASIAAAAVSGTGAAHREAMAGMWNTAPLISLIRDGADTGISNGDVLVDRRGRTHIRYRLGPTDTETLVASLDAAARLHLANGAQEVTTLHSVPVTIRSERDLPALRTASYAANRITLFSAHVNGTCRMGTNRALAATSPEGERYGTPGLFVCDGSLLPTALGVNPQATIMALSTIVARGIAAR